MDKSLLKPDELRQIRIARGLRLQSIRNSLHLTRQAFSDKFGVSIYTLQNWESNKNGGLTEQRAHTVVNMLKTADIHCNADWLLYGTGPAPSIANLGVLLVKESHAHYQVDYTDALNEELALFYKHYPQRAVHLEIIDDGNAPYYRPHDMVAGLRHFGERLSYLVGEVCIIYTKAGDQLVRQLKTGNIPNHYNLVCINSETTVSKPILYDIEIAMAAPIIWLRRPNNLL